MKGYRKILVAVNGSEEVLSKGLELARDERCWVTVVKVIPPHEGDLDLTGIRNLSDVLDSGAARAAERIGNVAEAERTLVRTRVEEGDVHEKIVEVAEEEDCDLIIMGADKTNWFKRLFGKNVVEKVLHRAPCPVLVLGT
jgi:nucleotide-binding universal stress UspA family protein